MKILITGATGFIGGHLLDAVVKEFGAGSVVAFASRELKGFNCAIYNDIKNFDLADYDFSEFTHLIHVGAFIPKNNKEANDVIRCNGNVFFTDGLLGLGFKKLIRIINISSVDVYGGAGVISEESQISPISLYGASKLYCEQMIKTFALEKDIKFINLRVGHVYGPGEEKYQKILPLAIQKILAEQDVEIWGDGSELRSYIYVGDVVKVILRALSYEPANLDLNVVSGTSISIRDLLLKVMEIAGKNVSLNSVASDHFKRDLLFDNSKLNQSLLGDEVELSAGLEREINYMKSFL